MSTAEQKVELVKMLLEADNETTEKIFQLMRQESIKTKSFSDEDIPYFEKIRDEFLDSGEDGVSVEEAHAAIRRGRK